MMNTRALIAIVAAGMAFSGATNARASELSLTDGQIAQVESGGGSPGEQAEYVFLCQKEPACAMALFQVWGKNGGDVPVARYAPRADQVPALFRGTDMGQKMIEMGAVSNCVRDDPCRAFLVSATKAIRSVPPEQLKQAYQDKSELDLDQARKNTAAQLRPRIAATVAQVSANLDPMPAAPGSVAVASEPVMDAGKSGSGEVIDFARDADKNVTFQLVKMPNGAREIQRRDAGGVKRLAGVMGREGKWLVEASDGTVAEAVDIQLTARGFVAGTREKIFSYSEGGGFSSARWPAGFHPAAVQRGDVTGTGFVLLERDSGGRAARGLFDSLSDMGQVLGLNKREDYMLFDLHSGREFPINLSLSGKNVSIVTGASGCGKRNALVNVCRDVTTDDRERLYDKLGMKNIRHYLWAVYWFKTPTGPYMIALEDGVATLSATKLDTGEKRIAFHRGLGISDFSVNQNEEGHIKVRANWAFMNHDIDDLETAFVGLPLPEGDKKEAQKNADAKIDSAP
jgi:hypothetical protein